MSSKDAGRRSYRFGPLERRGFVGGLRPGQVGCLAAGSIGAVVVFRTAPGGLTLVLALAMALGGAMLAFVPVAGRPVEAWTGVVVEWLLTDRRFRATAPTAGVIGGLDGAGMKRAVELPPALEGCRLLAYPIGDQDLGILVDERLRAITAVIAIRIRSVGLLPTVEHEARLERWGQLLAGLARNGSPVRRLQILQRALPGDADALWRHYLSARVDDSELDPSYSSLLDQTTEVTRDHEVLLAVQVDERRAWARAARDASLRGLSKQEQAQAVLLREIRTLASRFDATDVEVAGLLTADQYADALRHAYDPFARDEQRSGDASAARGGGDRRGLESAAQRRRMAPQLLDRPVAAASRRPAVHDSAGARSACRPQRLGARRARPAGPFAPRGRGRHHERRGRRGAQAPSRVPHHGAEAPSAGGDHAARGGARIRPRGDPPRRDS